MKYCTKCGAALPDETRFCSKCGAKAPQTAKMSSPRGAKQTLNKKAIIIAACVAAAVLIVLCVLVFTNGGQNNGGTSGAGTAGQQMPGTTQPSSAPSAGVTAELAETGTYYKLQTLSDPATNVPVVDTALPEGWQSSCVVDWNVVGTFPGLASITLQAPDNSAAVVFATQRGFCQTTMGPDIPADGTVDNENYVTNLDYRTAEQMADFMMDTMFPGAYSFTQNVAIDAKYQELFNKEAERATTERANNTVRDIQNGGVECTLDGMEWSIAKRRYEAKSSSGQPCFVEIMTATMGYQMTMGGMLQQIYWSVPFSLIYVAESKAVFDECYPVNETIFANMGIRPEFNYVNQQYRAYIDNMVAQNALARAQAASEVVNGYMNEYDSSSGDTNDRVTEMWSDYIYDQDSYTTSDGGTVKVPTSYDHVYETDSGEIYATNNTLDVPSSWDELS